MFTSTSSLKKHVLKLLSVLVCFVIIASVIPAKTVHADSGSCGSGLSWNYSNGVLTISGSGYMYDYPEHLHGPDSGNELAQPWFYLKPYITTINIENGVNSIGACAFWGCSAVTNVSIPSSVQSIGFAAFAECPALGEITIPAGVIGESAFIRCTGLQSVTIGPNVTAIGISAFESCTGLKGVYISNIANWCNIYFGGNKASPMEYAHKLYLNGELITNLTIPGSVTKVGDYAFEHCTSLTSVTFESGVTKIGEYAFNGCTNITSASIPATVTYIGSFAFASCAKMSATLPSSVSYIGERAFNGCPLNSSITINQGTIGERAFNACGSIVNLTIGSGVTYIGPHAFANMGGLKSINYGGTAANWSTLAAKSGYTGGATITYGNVASSIASDLQTVNFNNMTWQVLTISGGNALIISQDVIGFRQYSPNYSSRASMSSSWASSSLRSWLNSTFLNTFSAEQQAAIVATQVSTSANSKFGTIGSNGGAVTDKIFILSADEAERYFSSDEQRTALATDAALAGVGAARNGSAQSDPTTGNSYWWLRTPGMFSYDTAYVNYTGSVRLDGVESPTGTLIGVRPAMWVNAAYLGLSGSTTTTTTTTSTSTSTTTSTATSTGNANVDQIGAFVDRLYAQFLGRQADAVGREYWVNKLLNGATAAEVSAGFVFSTELKNMKLSNEEFVRRAYTVYLNREPDSVGLKYWVDILNRGNTYGAIIHGFAESTEFTEICNKYGVTRGSYAYNTK